MAKIKKPTEGLMLCPNGSWRRAEYIGGKRRFFTDKDPQQVWEKIRVAQIEYEQAKQQALAEQNAGPLFSEVCDEYALQLATMKNGTRKAYEPALRRAREQFGDYRMRQIEPYMIAQWLKSLPYAGTTVANHKTVLNNVFQLWVESPVWRGEENIAKKATMPRGLKRTKRPPPSDAQVEIVKANYLDPDALIAVAFLCTGERKGELCAVTLADIDFDNKVIHITKSVEHINNRPHLRNFTKTEAGIRSIPLLDMLAEALQPYRHMPKGTYIVGLQQTPITACRYRRLWEHFWRKYNQATPRTRTKLRNGKPDKYTEWDIPVCSHQFRHEYVCMLCIAGVSMEIAMQLVGHANEKMIREVYLALKPEMISDARNRLNQALARVQ